MDKWCVYILKWDKYYIGSTNDLDRRLQEHASGKTHTTQRIWSNIELYWYIVCESKQEARALEKNIKKWGHYARWIEKNSNKIIVPYTGL